MVVDTENIKSEKNPKFEGTSLWYVFGICQNTEGKFMFWYTLYLRDILPDEMAQLLLCQDLNLEGS